MKSDHPPDSTARFDALWESLDEEEESIPAALDPRPPGTRPLAAELRDTLLPPMPAPEYVQTMMELGELDDPEFPPPPQLPDDVAHARDVTPTPIPTGRSTPPAPLPGSSIAHRPVQIAVDPLP